MWASDIVVVYAPWIFGIVLLLAISVLITDHGIQSRAAARKGARRANI